MALDGAKFICLSDAAAADATEKTTTVTTRVEAGGISDASSSENIIIEAKGRKFTVGYYMNCDYVLEDPRAIGVHCEIQCDAFGRVTIHNNSEAHPISVNEQIITLKRPLLDGSRIKILDRNFLWKFPKSLEATVGSKSRQGGDVTSNDTISTPKKLVAVWEQAPNSCPDLKHHRKVDKRLTVHNFAFCINSDEEGNTSSELPSINESESVEEAATIELITQKESSKNGIFEEMSTEDKEILPTSTTSQYSTDDKITLGISNIERRSITPEPQKSESTIASTPLIKLEDTPIMNLINCTQNKRNKSTEKKQRLLSFCQQSDMVITSFSPRETGVHIEKSFTAVIKPTSICSIAPTSITPKSFYSTPKSIHSDDNDDESLNFIYFTTPATSKKSARVLARNSSMHLIDLTTPKKLAPDTPRYRFAHKGNKTLPCHVKLSTTPISSDKLKQYYARKEDACLLSKTLKLETSLNKSETFPQSAESIINIGETSDSSTTVIEISGDDSSTPNTSSPVRACFTTKPVQRPTGQKPFSSTPLRTSQSLLKRAIVTSAKKQINSSLRTALGKAPARQLTSKPVHNRKFDATDPIELTPSTSKSRISIGSPGSVAAAQRLNISSLTRRRSIGESCNREHVIIPPTTPYTRLKQNRKIPSSASRLATAKCTSPPSEVSKSFGGATFTSHVSKTCRSIISPRRHSPTSIASKLAAKARKSFISSCQKNRQVSSRAHSLVAAAMRQKNDIPNPTPLDTTSQKKEIFETVEDTTGKEVKNETSLEEQNEADDLSRTFTVDDSLEEVQIITSNPATPFVLNASKSQKVELNKTSPEKSEVTVDVAEIGFKSQNEGPPDNLKVKEDIIITERISESFAEVVESNAKREQKIKNLETLMDCVQIGQQNAIVAETPEMSGYHSEPEMQADDVKNTAEKMVEVHNQRDSKLTEQQVIETLDAGEISSNVSVGLRHSTTKEAHVLTPPSSSETIDTEDMPNPSGESQGTAELLEEIEYVLNKSDELQQQLSKDAQTSNIEVTDEFEAAIEDNLSNEIEDFATKNNTKTDVNINVEINQNIEQAEDSEATVKDELATSTLHSLVTTSSDRRESKEDTTLIDSNILATASEITSTDLDAGLMQTDLLSISSIATPSEFDVSTIASSSVEKLVVSHERAKNDENIENTMQSTNLEIGEITIDLDSKVTENDTSIKAELAVTDAMEAETVAEAELTASDVEDIVLTTENLETKNENEEDSVNKSKIDVISSIKTVENPKDSQPTFKLGGETKGTQENVITQTEPIDNNIQKTVDNNKEAEITANETEPIATEFKETENFATELKECTSVTSDSKVTFKTIGDAEKVAAETRPLSISSKTIAAISEPKSIVEEKTKPQIEDQIAKNSDRNSDNEKENSILAAEEFKTISTDIPDDAKKISSYEPKSLNLCGMRDMLKTPKQTDANTPRFVGLRNLMCTPKASTSAAAAAAGVEDEKEDLIGVQKLLEMPHLSKINSDNVEGRKFTHRHSIRRSASENPELTPTPNIVTETDNSPRRTTRRRTSASAEVNYTPQRITRRRSSLALDNEGAVEKVLTPIKRGGLRSKRPGKLAEAPVAEDMGAIIEEEPKECIQELTEGQGDFVETQEKKEDVKTEISVHDVPEVIEESICEEVNTQKQEFEEQKEEIVYDKSNKKCEKAKTSKNEIEPICVTEKLDEDADKAEIATEFESQPQETQVQEVVPASSCNVSEVHKEGRILATKDITKDKTAEILDESDYEYGKEVIEQSEASTDTQPEAPKTQRKSVRIADTNTEESPKTPVMVDIPERIKSPKDCGNTTKFIGIRDLVRTPKTTIPSATTAGVNDAERLVGLADSMKTPKVAKTHCENVKATEEDVKPSTSNKTHSDTIGMRELLSTLKHTSTPYYSGMREMLSTPKACSTPQLAGVRELMQTPKRIKLDVEYDDKNEELDQFFKTPRAKNIMIPADPASAILEPSSDSSAEIMMAATTEYELHSNSQRPLEEIYKTPMSTRLTNVEIEQSEKKTGEIKVMKDTNLTGTPEFQLNVPETPAANCDNPQKAPTSKRNLSAEEAFDAMVGLRTTLDDTPPQKVYVRKQQSIVAVSPFSATHVISDLPKTDIQEWVDNLEKEPESVVEDEEFTASTSILDASKATHDPIAASVSEISGVCMNKDTTEELLVDMSAAFSMVDPLQPSATKTSSSLTIAVDENVTLRPVTPINTEISGIILLDQTNESVFSEALVVSDTESEQLEGNENNEVETENSVNMSVVDANNSQDGEEFPIIFVDSSDSEHEEDMKRTEKSDAKKVVVKSSTEGLKPTPEEEVMELDDKSTANAYLIHKPSDIHEELSYFQTHKNIAGQHMRTSTPNRSIIQSTRKRRQSMSAEQLITINVSLEKSRLTKEKQRTKIDTVEDVDEESVDATTVKDKLTKIEEAPIETSVNETATKSVIPINDNSSATTSVSKDNESEFSSFHVNKPITTRGMRAVTPEQVNKSRSQKITQGRRLTLGAEQLLPNATIDFLEEKLKLVHSDENPLERDPLNAKLTEEVETIENTIEVTISAIEPNKTSNFANDAEVVKDEDKVDSKEETACDMRINTLRKSGKKINKGSDEPEKNLVQDSEAKISLMDKDAQTISNIAECSAEGSQTYVMISGNVEENVADVCESATVEDLSAVSDNDTPSITLTVEEETRKSYVSELINEAKSIYTENKLEEFEGATVKEISQVESTKHDERNEECTEITDAPATIIVTQEITETIDEEKTEISMYSTIDIYDNGKVESTVGTVEVKSEERDLAASCSTTVKEIETGASARKENENKSEEKDHQVPDNVSLKASESHLESYTAALEPENKMSSARDEFNESDIFDLIEELTNETPTINTTQGVIFDLTEEDVEGTVETNTAENVTHDEQKQHDVIETAEDSKRTALIDKNTNEGNAESRSVRADQKIALSKEIQAENTEVLSGVPCESQIGEKEADSTVIEELEASTEEMSPLHTNSSTDNEAFTLALSTETELENDEMPEVELETAKTIRDAAQEVFVAKADTNSEVEEPSNQPVQVDIKNYVETEVAVTELHSDPEKTREVPPATITTESTQISMAEAELSETYDLTEGKKADIKLEIPTSTNLTADKRGTTDSKGSNEVVRTNFEECIKSKKVVSPTISPKIVETELASKETEENEEIKEVHEAANGSEHFPTNDFALTTVEIIEDVKEKAVTAAEIVKKLEQAPVNQEYSEVIGNNEETGAQPSCSKPPGKETDGAETTPLIIADSTMSHIVQQIAEPSETVIDEVKAPKEESHKNTEVEESDKSFVVHAQASELLKENKIKASAHQILLAEDNIEEQHMETPTFSGKRQLAKRRLYTPSKQNAEEEPICKSPIKSKPLVKEKLTIEAQIHVDTEEEEKMKQTGILEPAPSTRQSEVKRISKVAESREDASKMSVKETSESGENLEKPHETSDEIRVPAKRKGRKGSRSKRTTEENVDLLSTTAMENTTLVEELELSDDKKALTATRNYKESPGVVQTTADAAVATSTRHKTKSEFYKKVNYELCISESADTAHDVKTDKPVMLELPNQGEKSVKDNKYTEQPEVVAIATDRKLTSSIEHDEETVATEITSKAEEVLEPRRARRIRKGSQSSQYSAHDEDLPTTTIKRRGGRRRAGTPLEHIVIEVTTSDVSTVKRRRQGQDKVAEDKPVEEIQEVQIDEREIANREEDVSEVGCIPEETKGKESGPNIEEESSEGINNEVKKTDGNQLEEVSRPTTSKEQHIESENAMVKKSTNNRQRVAKATYEVGDGLIKDSLHSDADELSNVPAAIKRSRRKPTLSESSQTSVTIENTESHVTKGRRRGHNTALDKPTINETIEGTQNNILHKNETLQSKKHDATILPVLPTTAIAVDASIEDEDSVKGDSDTIKTELKIEDHSTTGDSSKGTRNKRTRKARNKELTDEIKDIKMESHDEKADVEQEQPIKKPTAASRTRVNRRKKAETDEHHDKTEETDQVYKGEGILEMESQNKVEVSEKAVVESTNTNADSVGGRRGRRGAAAVATVAINEVSSAHKRGALRGKSHQNRSHAIQKEEEAKKIADAELHSETATDHDEAPTVVEDEKAHKSIRRRRISLKEMLLSDVAITEEGEGEGVEKIETEEDAGSSTKVAPKRSRKRRKSHHAGEPQTLNKSEMRDEIPTSAPAASPPAASSTQRGRRKRKDSHHNINDVVVGDEPPKKRPLSRKRRDSSLDSSVHEGTVIDMDTNRGTNNSSSSTTPQRPRRAAAAQDRNYDESSDAEAQVDLKRRIEKASLPKASISTAAATAYSPSKQRTPTTAKTPIKEMVPAAVAEITAKTTSTPILSTAITTSRGRQRKPTARVQQYLEEERAKAETPKKRLLIGSAAVGITPTSQAGGTLVRRTRKATTVETKGSETLHTSARGRTRTTKALHGAETSEESRSEVEHTHSELEKTHSSSHVEAKEQTTKAKAAKRPTRGRGKQPIAAMVESETPVVPVTMVATPTEVTHTGSGRAGRAAKAAAAAALITDDPIGSHTKARVGRTRRGVDIAVNEDVHQSDAEVRKLRTEVVVTPTAGVEQTNKKTRKVVMGGRTARGGHGRKKQQDLEDYTDEHTTQHALLAEDKVSTSDALQQQSQHSIIADADDEHEDDEETLTLTTEAADLEVATSLAGAKLEGKKRTIATRKAAAVTASAAESPIPKRGRRRAVAAIAEEGDATSHLDTRAESAASIRSRKVVRFDAATPSSVTSATMSVDTATEETEEATSAPTAPAKRATRSRRK